MRQACLLMWPIWLTSAPALAEGDCAVLLKDGLYNYQGVESERFHYDQFRNFLETHNFKSDKEASESAASLGFNLASYVSLDFSSASKNDSWTTLKSDFLKDTFEKTIDTLKDKSVFRSPNTKLGELYKDCILHQTGVWAYIDASSNLDFVVHYGLAPGTSGVYSVKVKNFSISHAAKCNPEPNSIKTVDASSPGQINCTKDSVDQTSVVSLWTDRLSPDGKSPVFPVYKEITYPNFFVSGSGHAYGRIQGNREFRVFWNQINGKPATDASYGQAHLLERIPVSLSKFDHITELYARLEKPCHDVELTEQRENDTQTTITASAVCPALGTPPHTIGYAPQVFASVSTEFRSDSVLIFSDDRAKKSWDIPISSKMEPSVDWQGVAFDFHIVGYDGKTYYLYKHEDGNAAVADGPFGYIIDRSFDVHISLK